MTRSEYVLAVLSAADGKSHTPVQVQKLFFLLDKKLSHQDDWPRFNFRAWDYGPFDSDVYSEIEGLEARQLVEISRESGAGLRIYRTTPTGQQEGSSLLRKLDIRMSSYIRRLSEWVHKQSFAELVSAVYKEYPEMRVNSVFQGK